MTLLAFNDEVGKGDGSDVATVAYIHALISFRHHNARATLPLALIEPLLCPKIGISALCSIPYIDIESNPASEVINLIGKDRAVETRTFNARGTTALFALFARTVAAL